MSIAPATTQEQLDRSQTRLFLSVILKVIEGTHPDKEQGVRLMGRLFATTQIAAGKKKGMCADYRRNYVRALGATEADRFLKRFNACIRLYKKELKQQRDPSFRFERASDKKSIIDALKELVRSTEDLYGFFIPYPSMGHPPRDTRRCTGR